MAIDRQPTPVFFGRVEDGRLKLHERDAFQQFLNRLNGKLVAVKVVKKSHQRSLSQNAYYWGVVIPLFAESQGYENEEMHEALKFKFLQKHTDTELPTVGSTADLDTGQFTEYIEKVRRLAAEYGCVIPDPGAVE